ncbi:inositol monophosphatase family protein [Nocardia sp. NPDC056100]|uniref:inositol monophosphatase family protein n=1 Tax=Nocardia sp. NPDC056100 TaxID=3345712 RepID=UPI0035DAC9C0
MDSDVEIAIRAAEAASEVLRAAFRGPVEHYAKEGDDFATQADIAAEQAILAVISAARPEDRFIAEESGRSGTSHGDRVWLIDPLCGTRNFAVGTPEVAVNIALRVANSLDIAVVADPFSGEICWTAGTGAFARRDGVDQVLTPRADSKLVDIDVDPPYPNRGTFSAGRLFDDEHFMTRFHPRVLSTTLALAWVAAGRRAAYVTDGDFRDNVHFSSGIALCHAAGCRVTGLAGEDVLAGAHGLVAAADAATHERLLEIIARQAVTDR